MTSFKLARAERARSADHWPTPRHEVDSRPRFTPDPAPTHSEPPWASPQERALLDQSFSDLTQREREVLFALCAGGSNERVADGLCIALPTLRTHLMRLHQKLGTSGKSELVSMVWRRMVEGYRSGRLGSASPNEGRPEKSCGG